MRMVPGPLRGALYAAARASGRISATAPPDGDEFVKHRVESALGRKRDLPIHSINLDATDGIVRVRGTVPDERSA
ncbi:MAG: hypothetical protein ACRD0L_10240, partial [Acidimicrobiales bacterium]